MVVTAFVIAAATWIVPEPVDDPRSDQKLRSCNVVLLHPCSLTQSRDIRRLNLARLLGSSYALLVALWDSVKVRIQLASLFWF